MDLLVNSDQELVADAIGDLLDAMSPPGRLRQLAETGPVADPQLWKLAAEQGWFGLDLPEELGGAGLGLAEQTLLFRELGRHLTAGPYLGTAVAAHVAAAAGDLPMVGRIGRGELRVGLAELMTGSGLDDLAGQRMLTYDVDDADAFVCVTPGGSALIDAGDAPIASRRTCIDTASHWAELKVSAAPAIVVPDERFAARDYGRILVAAMLSGITAETSRLSAEYAKVRVQFGRPIGSFQAVQHRCAEQAVRAEAAIDLVTLAALTLSSADPNGRLLAASASLIAGSYAQANCGDNIQNHGGIGYTDEHDAHLFLKRSLVLALVLGDSADKRRDVLGAQLHHL